MIKLNELGDERGGLVVIEEDDLLVPFPIKRVFYEYNTACDITRGNHANKNSKFAMVSISGYCTIEIDDGKDKKKYKLDSPLKLLIVDKMTWKIMKEFSKDNILLVLSDHKYDGSEYITDYDEFLTLSQGEKI